MRVWAPRAARVEVVLDSGERTALDARWRRLLQPATFEARRRRPVPLQARTTTKSCIPDPASRFQPDGPHGPSEIVDPRALSLDRRGVARRAAAKARSSTRCTSARSRATGTWAAARDELRELARIGVTVIEMMPVAEFDGRFGWGYDGVDLFAPTHLYGTPDDLRRFVDAAHALGLGVILDVVYNHLGPVGNYLRAFSPAYFTDRYDNEWGDAINFDGPDAGAGARVLRRPTPATGSTSSISTACASTRRSRSSIASDEHVLTAIGRRAREAAGRGRVVIVAENEPQDTRLVRPIAEGGYGLDALWNDDFHHSAMVALTGRAEAYYSDTRGEPQEFVSAAKYGFLFQGQHYHWQRKPRGTPAWGLPPAAFVVFLQNHDQVANSARGLRGASS